MDDISSEDLFCLHLYTVENTERTPAPYEISIPGIVDAMDVGTNAIAGRFKLLSTLSTLLEEGSIVERTTTVESMDGERPVYLLTDKGRDRADELLDAVSGKSLTVMTASGRQSMSIETVVDRTDGTFATVLARMDDGTIVLEEEIDRAIDSGAAPFVGREDELSWIDDKLDRAIAGTPATALVTGSPGIGKTTLLKERAERVRDAGGWFLHGQCQPGVNEPYQPMFDALEGLPAERREPLRAILTSDSEDELEDPDDLRTRRRSMFARVSEQLANLADDRPLVLFLDDVTWIDQATAMLFAHLTATLKDASVLLVAAFRPETDEDQNPLIATIEDIGDERIDRLELVPFDRDTTEMLLYRLLGTSDIPAEFVEEVHRRTGGNPLFVTESINRMINERLVRPAVDIYPETADEYRIPDSVNELIAARVEELDAETYQLLEVASLVGDLLPEPVVKAASELAPDICDERIESLVESQIWIRTGPEALRFRSGVTRETIRERITDSQRRTLHRRLADAYQTHFEREEIHGAAVAYHHEQAGNHTAAIDASLTAAAQAIDVYAHEVAIDACERALSLAREIDDDDTVVTALKRLGETYQVVGEYEEAKRCFQYIRDRHSDHITVGHMHRKEGIVARKEGDLEAAREQIQRALEIAHEHEDRRGIAQCLTELGVVEEKAGKLADAEDHLQAGLEQYQRLDDRSGEAEVRRNLGVVRWKLEEKNAAGEDYEESLKLFEAIGDRRGQAKCLNNLGMVAEWAGSVEEAREYYERSLELKERIGDRHAQARTLNNLGGLAWRQGNIRVAKEHTQRSLDMLRDLGDRRGEARQLNNLGLLAKEEDDLSSAREYHQQSLEILREVGDRYGQAQNHRNLGSVAERVENLTEARERYEQALELFEAVGGPTSIAQCTGLLGAIDLREGAIADGRQRLERSLERFPDEPTEERRQILRKHIEAEIEADSINRAKSLCERAEELSDRPLSELGSEGKRIAALRESL